MTRDTYLRSLHRSKQGSCIGERTNCIQPMVIRSNKYSCNDQPACDIRNRYLTTLGFKVSPQTKGGTKNIFSDRNICKKSVTFEQPIKFTSERSTVDLSRNAPTRPAAETHENASETTNGCSCRKLSVSFQPIVTVCCIPSRHSYSTRVKKNLWPDSAELSGNTQRNLIEFAFENNDWRQVIEEDRFYLCKTTGKRIHPVHYARMLLQRQYPYFSNVPSVLKKSVMQYSSIASMNWVHHK